MLTLNSDKLTTDTRRELQLAEQRVARATAWLQKCEGERDQLVLALADHEGAHDRRFVPVR
ncbi:MAG: hypothetical protein WD872_09635 [Pirellulaceae bacterium]